MKLTVSQVCFIFILAGFVFVMPVVAQDSTPPVNYRGFNAYENFRGVVNSTGNLIKLDSTVGYDFNRHVGIFAGVPVYFTNNSGTSTGLGNINQNGIGDAYFGVDLFAPGRLVDYNTTLTVSAPTGNVAKGFSPGEVTADWNNRIKHSFGRLTPFVSAGVGNTVPDTELITRAFSSLGTVAHTEEGAEFQLAKRVYVGGSAYNIFPFGNQQVFDRLDGATDRAGQGNNATGTTNSGKGGGNGNGGSSLVTGNTVTAAAQATASGNNLTRENGVDAWLGFQASRIARVEFGYSRSMTFATNSFSFNVGLNVGRILRSRSSISDKN